ncbi:MAG TPA: hypothetical protein VFK69_03745 [Candidatus Eisenbacteria bacterium]|nr:hypothetical protein [Candidatus Eisenbacteria bacterium]
MPAPGDSLLALLPVQTAEEPGGGNSGSAGVVAPFTVRRVMNPRYRPPVQNRSALPPGAAGAPKVLDHYGAHVVHVGGLQQQLVWGLSAGELARDNRSLEFAVEGQRLRGEDALRALTLSGHAGPLTAALGDPDAVAASRDATFQRLRGAVLRYEARDRPTALVLGGFSRPIPDAPQPRISVGGAAVQELRYGAAAMSASVFAAARRAALPARFGANGADTLAGRGVFGSFGWRVPIGQSRLSQEFGLQSHDLAGGPSLAVEQRLDWTLQTRALLVALGAERASPDARTLGTDRLAQAPRREDRVSVQDRFDKGRAETHLTALVREGGDSTLAARTLQLGGSSSLGRGPWYGGGDATWDRRRFLGLDERRFALYAGGVFRSGHALLARLERSDRPGGPAALTALSEAAIALPHALRLALEPRATWNAGAFGSAEFTTRLSAPFGWLSSRVTGAIAVGAERERAFRGQVREASIAISFAPNVRDRGDVQVERLEDGGRPYLQSSTSYDAQRERYLTPAARAGLDTARVTVRVTRTGNGSGVGEAVVSLDGRELRFTDADGMAEFENVPPGVHVVALEERSLPDGYEVVTTSRVWVTVERGVAVDPVEFRIARPERRTQF